MPVSSDKMSLVIEPSATTNWYRDAVFYMLPVRSYFDGNGDGIGDFLGLESKLDYLEELGITCIWLLPYYPSPWRDDGYDVSDYRDVHPSYGSMDDFRRFLENARRRRLRHRGTPDQPYGGGSSLVSNGPTRTDRVCRCGTFMYGAGRSPME